MSYLNDNGQPALIKDSMEGVETIPSLLYYDPDSGDWYVGHAARRQAENKGVIAQNLLHSFKRLLGKKYAAYFLLCNVVTIYRMSEKLEAVSRIKESYANLVLEGRGKDKDRPTFIVKRRKNGELSDVELKPSTLVRHLVQHALKLVVREKKEVVELLLTTVPGTSFSIVQSCVFSAFFLSYL